jgi:thiamine-phosphate pyrophosphorylase
MLDANANRCREGLRVAEDAARFVLEDPASARLAKNLRHRVTRGMALLGQGREFLASRDAEGDLGRRSFGRWERQRSGLASVVASNLHRAQEAARVLEEFGKLSSSQASLAFKRLRYGIYGLEKKLSKS